MKKDGERRGIEEEIMAIAKSLSPAAGKRVLSAYGEMSFSVKSAVNRFYESLDGLHDKASIAAVNEALVRLKNACEANPSYKAVYDAAMREAKEAIADAVANEGISLLGNDE